MLLAVVAVVATGALVSAAVVVRSVVGVGCVRPAVVGQPITAARAALSDEAIEAVTDEDVVTEQWRADLAAEGTVIDQDTRSCDRQVMLVVSDGGPVVPLSEVPAEYRELLGANGPVAAVRSITTPAGRAYKSDDALVGDCRAVREAVGKIQDDDVTLRCLTPIEQRLAEVVLFSAATWWGQAPSGSEGLRTVDDDPSTTWQATLRRDGWEVRVVVSLADPAAQAVQVTLNPVTADAALAMPPVSDEQLAALATKLQRTLP